MRILIGDDHELIREGIKRLLSDTSDVSDVGGVRDAAEVLTALERERWDLLILDINLPGRSGLDVLQEIKQRYPKLPVLILSMYPEELFAVRVMKAGAAGYISKAGAADELATAIRTIAAGGKYISPTLAEHLADAVHSKIAQAPHELLSTREFEVFKLIASGKTVGEIARILHRSIKTISTHRTHILEKMHLRNNAEIMQYAVEHRLM